MSTISKKIISFIIVVVLMMSFTGCDLLDSFASSRVERYIDRFMESFISDPYDAHSDFSKKEFKISSLGDYEYELFSEVMSKAEISCKSIIMTDNRHKAKVTIELEDFPTRDSSSPLFAQEDSIMDLIDSMSTDITIKLNLKRLSPTEWIFEDLSSFYDEVYSFFSGIYVIDENGLPIDGNPCVVYGGWYDPISANPLSEDQALYQPPVICYGLYFMYPTSTDSLVAILMRDGEEIASKELTINQEVFFNIEFEESLLGGIIDQGSYEVKIYNQEQLLHESSSLSVV